MTIGKSAFAATVAIVAAWLAIATLHDAKAADEPKKDEPAATAPAVPVAPSAADLASDDPAVAAAAKKAQEAFQIASRKITPVTGKPPLEVAKANPIGTMRNPYTDNAEHIEEGKKLYFSYSCNGCHGGGGGGGMCPALTNDIWVYGSDDDMLFRLISHGSQDLQKTYSLKRKGSEGVVGPMPPFGELMKSDDELWKIIAFVHSLNKGKRNW